MAAGAAAGPGAVELTTRAGTGAVELTTRGAELTTRGALSPRDEFQMQLFCNGLQPVTGPIFNQIEHAVQRWQVEEDGRFTLTLKDKVRVVMTKGPYQGAALCFAKEVQGRIHDNGIVFREGCVRYHVTIKDAGILLNGTYEESVLSIKNVEPPMDALLARRSPRLTVTAKAKFIFTKVVSHTETDSALFEMVIDGAPRLAGRSEEEKKG